MHFRHLALALSLLTSLAATSAGAVTFVGYDTSLPAGETLITDFSNSAAANLSGDGLFETGSYSFSAAPAFSASTRDPNQYLSLQTGQSETVSFAPMDTVSIYVGSLDSYNSISFSNGETFTGGQLAALTGAVDDGDQQSSSSNGRFIFNFSAPVTSVTLSSSNIAFEVADIAGGVPEPAAWAMMLLGIGAVGAAMRAGRGRYKLTAAA